MVAVPATKEVAALAVTGTGGWIAVCTGDPGTTATPAAEAVGGSPAYARKQTTWTGGTADGVVTGSEVTIDVPAGTYTYIALCSASTGNNMIDKAAITSAVFDGQGQLKITPTFTST